MDVLRLPEDPDADGRDAPAPPLAPRPTARLALKRAIDIVAGGSGLLLATPLLVFASLASLHSPGPVLRRQTRCGLHGRHFTQYGLRMPPNALGQLLRRCSVDEIPLLWNVLIGDMSLVGPRPPDPSELARAERAARRCLAMRPGLTCLWQVSGREPIGVADWLKLDLQYVESWSLTGDLKILVTTLPAVVRSARG